MFYDRIYTRRLFAEVAARLKRHIHDSSLCLRRISQAGKCSALCMKLTVSHMIAFAYDSPSLHDNRAHKRIRIHRAGSLFRKFNCASHVCQIKLIIYMIVYHSLTFPTKKPRRISPRFFRTMSHKNHITDAV